MCTRAPRPVSSRHDDGGRPGSGRAHRAGHRRGQRHRPGGGPAPRGGRRGGTRGGRRRAGGEGGGGRDRRPADPRRPGRPGPDSRAPRAGRRAGQQRRPAGRGGAHRVSRRQVQPAPAGHGGGAVPAGQAGAAAHVRARLGPDRQHLLGARAARLPVQGGLRHRQARAGGTVQGDRPGRGRARCHVQLRQPGLRADPAGRPADRRPGAAQRPPGVRGDRKGDAGARGRSNGWSSPPTSPSWWPTCARRPPR